MKDVQPIAVCDVRDWQVKKVPFKANKATLLAGGGSLKAESTGSETTIRLPETLADPNATVIRLD